MLVTDGEVLSGDVDPRCEGVQAQGHAGGFEVGVGPVGEGLPRLDLAGEVVGDAADGEVRVGVRDDHRHVHRGVEFPRAESGGDTGVTAADDCEMHEGAFQS